MALLPMNYANVANQVLETLLENGFSKEEFLLADIRKLTVCLENNLKIQKGIVGFGE
jgi:hypothetical protein